MGLAGAVIGAVLQSSTTRDVEAQKAAAMVDVERTRVEGNLRLKEQKQLAAQALEEKNFEATLILKAIEMPDRQQAIRNLRFFLRAGFIIDEDGRIANLSPEAYPSLSPLVSRLGSTSRNAPGPKPGGNHAAGPGDADRADRDGAGRADGPGAPAAYRPGPGPGRARARIVLRCADGVTDQTVAGERGGARRRGPHTRSARGASASPPSAAGRAGR